MYPKHRSDGQRSLSRRKYKLIVDSVVELSDATLKFNRLSYESSQIALRNAALVKKRLRYLERRTDYLIWAPPETFRAPELLEFWYSTWRSMVPGKHGPNRIEDPERRIDYMTWAPPETFRSPELLKVWYSTSRAPPSGSH
ncbi:hypothetical protein AURDEDRAFT_169305 [Auricularia subglabra TFB-10046 SS5]|nr:hypothetical protein AURDEDRAFT_169305 [Auricularia subglabra TFB-10046 SS5]